jgi:hypothetical protein
MPYPHSAVTERSLPFQRPSGAQELQALREKQEKHLEGVWDVSLTMIKKREQEFTKRQQAYERNPKGKNIKRDFEHAKDMLDKAPKIASEAFDFINKIKIARGRQELVRKEGRSPRFSETVDSLTCKEVEHLAKAWKVSRKILEHNLTKATSQGALWAKLIMRYANGRLVGMGKNGLFWDEERNRDLQSGRC